ncbi:RRAGD [Cordylochernes scorpioides]|uniref:RRAGD n=1 Tax=Cordylochernes scorpioides TaxID=51811 RepID=A0ABY6KKX7_9ARAC|nr:RRAGD [Cordylochernes scorpioides]
MKNLKENSSENQNNANSPAGDMHVNLPAARGDVTAPPTAASTSATTPNPTSLNWADSEMAEVDANDGYTVVKSKKRRLTSTPEHAVRQPGRPAEKPSLQKRKRPTGPRAVPPQEIKATRANIADARARQATTNHENYVFVELCPDIPDYSYLKAMSTLLGVPKSITQFNRMNGHHVVGLANKELANRLVADGLEIEGTSLKVFPFRKRAERIVVANLPGFVEDSTIVNTLGQFGKVTSIAPILVKMGEFTFTDGRREAFILLREGVRLETLPTRLNIQSKGDTLSAFLSFGVKCSKCGKQGHRRANCPALARQGNGSPRQAASPTDARPPLPPPQRLRKPAPAPATPASPVQPAKTSAEAQAIPSAHQPAEQMDLTHPAPAAHPAPLRPPEPRIPPLDHEMSVEKLSSPPATPARGKAALEQLLEHLRKSPNPSIDWDKLPDLNCEEAQKLLTSETTMKRRAPTLTEEQFTALDKLHETIKALCPDSNSTIRKTLQKTRKHLLALLESACSRWTPFTRGLSLVGRARAANSLVGSTIQHHLHGYLPSPPTIAKLQARLARFVWGPEHTAWPVAIGGLGLLDLATQLQLACLKGVQVALRGGRNGFDWLVASGSKAWIRPPLDGTRLQPRRLRLLKLWEEASKILSLNHRAVPASLLLDIPIIGGCRFLRPPDLLAPARWRGARVRDLLAEGHLTARPTRSALADAAALGAFCRRLTSENAVGFRAESAPSSSSLAAAVVLRGTATSFLNGLTTRSARRALDRPRLAATPISRFTSRRSPTIGPPPSRIDWASLRRCAHSGHEADAALKLALHALPHPAHPASVGPSCPACGSIDRSLGHRYWCCRSIRPLIREAFNIIGRPPDLQAWIFGGSGLEDDALSILASAKLRIYRYFVQSVAAEEEEAQPYVMGSFPKDFGYGHDERPDFQSQLPHEEKIKPRILLMGLRRSGKSSIQKVVFHKMSPNETLFLGSTSQIMKDDISNSSFVQFQIWDFPGQIDFFDVTFDSENIFGQCGALVFVIDGQVNPEIRFEVFIHKVDGLTEENKMETQRDIQHRVREELLVDSECGEGLNLSTSSKCVVVYVQNSVIEKAFLFDVVSKIYIATDSSPVDMQSYELCCDMIDVVIDISCIYGLPEEGGGETSPFDCQSASVIKLNNSTVLYLREVNQFLALVCILREDNFERRGMVFSGWMCPGLIDYNFHCFRDAIREVLEVRYNTVVGESSVVPTNGYPEIN